MDAPLEPLLLKLNNVNDNLPMEKCFLNLTVLCLNEDLKGCGLGPKFLKERQSQKGELNDNI